MKVGQVLKGIRTLDMRLTKKKKQFKVTVVSSKASVIQELYDTKCLLCIASSK